MYCIVYIYFLSVFLWESQLSIVALGYPDFTQPLFASGSIDWTVLKGSKWSTTFLDLIGLINHAPPPITAK